MFLASSFALSLSVSKGFSPSETTCLQDIQSNTMVSSCWKGMRILEFPLRMIPGEMIPRHVNSMSKPPQLLRNNAGFNACLTGKTENFCMRDFILTGEAYNLL